MTPINAIQNHIAYRTRGKLFSPIRVMAMVYLADWYACLARGRTITGGKWRFFEGFPMLEGGSVTPSEEAYRLNTLETRAVETALKDTLHLDQVDFEKFIQSTYPAIAVAHGATMDMRRFARAFIELQQQAA